MFNNTHDRFNTFRNIFRPYLSNLLLKFWEIYEKCFNSVNFWARIFFLKWVRILQEIDWYHYLGASPAPSCKVRQQTLIKNPMRFMSHQSPVLMNINYGMIYDGAILICGRIVPQTLHIEIMPHFTIYFCMSNLREATQTDWILTNWAENCKLILELIICVINHYFCVSLHLF